MKEEKNHSKRNFYKKRVGKLVFAAFLVVVLSFQENSHGKSFLPEGFNSLPKEVQEALLLGNQIKTLKAELEQLIIQNGQRESRRGYFWANREGKFRIQYFVPKELVVFDGENLYWYIPENGFSWLLPLSYKKDFINPLEKNGISKNSRITYEKPWWSPFFPQDKVVFFIEEENSKMELTFSLKLGQVTQRITYLNKKKVYEENFQEYTTCSGLPFFRLVKVKAFRGKSYTYSETRYKNALCNEVLPADLFQKPAYPTRRYPSP